MWFKNLTLFDFQEPFEQPAAELAEALSGMRFRPCPDHEPSTRGWSAPLGVPDGPLVHSIGDTHLLRLTLEERLLPASVVREKLAEQVEEIEQREHRKVGRKEQRDLREHLEQSLLPDAFTRKRSTFGYIDAERGVLAVDNATDKRVEDFTTALREALGSLPVRPVASREDPGLIMTEWLRDQDLPGGFELDGECVLRDPDDTRVVARLRQEDLGGEEVQAHLAAGKRVSQLAVNWEDRLRLVVGDDLRVRRVRFLDSVQEKLDDMPQDSREQEMDARFHLMSEEFRGLHDALLAAFGGPAEG